MEHNDFDFMEDGDPRIPDDLTPEQINRFVTVFNSSISHDFTVDYALAMAKEGLMTPEDRLPEGEETYVERIY